MEYKIEIPEYNDCFQFVWEDDFKIEIKIEDDTVLLKANKPGLISLARHLINLSQDYFYPGYHFHLDSYACLEEGSNELIIEKE